MSRTHYAFFLLVLLVPAPALAAPAERVSSVADRERVNLTVYNAGLALVHDRRRVALSDGFNRVAWRDVSAHIDSTSSLLETIGPGAPVRVLEQNYDYDLLDPSALLQKYVGRDVVVVHPARFAGERDSRETARVLSTNGGVVLQYRDRIETEVRGYIAFPASTQNFRDEPTLVLDLDSPHGGEATLDLSYLTTGLSWYATYVGSMSADESHLALTGLVTLSNQSGIPYEDAHLQLVAGNVNVAPPVGALRTIAHVTTADEYAVNGVSQENYFEYHLYTLAHPTTILNRQTKQVTLLVARDVPIKKTLELRGSQDYYRTTEPDLGDHLPVGVYVSFQNKGGDLGIPLPGGVVRLYKNDSRGTSQFLGSDSMQHTPRNETVRLHLGDAFDVTARKRQTDFHLQDGCVAESSYEIVLSNAKTIAQEVLVVESIPGDWQIVAENLRHNRSSASTASWLVRVPPDSSANLTYTAHVKWC